MRSLVLYHDGCAVADLAKRFGGGGHKNASGFESELSFDALRKETT